MDSEANTDDDSKERDEELLRLLTLHLQHPVAQSHRIERFLLEQTLEQHVF
jgi:hypothetical protein